MAGTELFFLAALFFYSLAIWAHKAAGKLHHWMLWTFGLGLIADILGTILLCIMSAERWNFTIHTVSGLASLLIMAVHFIWAFLALTIKGTFEAYFNRFSIRAWFLWLVAFVSGIPL